MTRVATPGDEDLRGPSQRAFDAIVAQLVLADNFGGARPRLGEDYEIYRVLGSGGFGLVVEARIRGIFGN